jgi:FAD/FMN-containing dehydrogenase
VPTLTAYAVDASIYRMQPQAVVLAEHEGDIDTVVRFAVERGIPLTPRAAGTNLTGSAIGSGIILDISKMNRILEVNEEERWARVQPGIVLAELNKQLGRRNLLFGPDPSSGDMCKLGGMLANNSAGPHTLIYGAVKDNVQAMRVCLPVRLLALRFLDEPQRSGTGSDPRGPSVAQADPRPRPAAARPDRQQEADGQQEQLRV